MSTVDLFVTKLRTHKIVAIVRSSSAQAAIDTGQRLVDAGVEILEISLNTPEAVSAIAGLRGLAQERGVVIGAGTVLDAADVARVAEVGARFYVAPIFNPDAVVTARELGLAAVPGCCTPTEMWQAHAAGAAAIKLFPAVGWSPAGMRNVLRAMPFLNVIPTGGVSIKDADAWLDAGAAGLGIGSALDDPAALHELATIVASRQSVGAR
jgi:2-dehydro-3-deoxyphosphogluconate aldolase/(4S)-4-hydroxy-2-oxoglutarate aldolase